MGKIIMLYGPENSGKSTTLSKLFSELTEGEKKNVILKQKINDVDYDFLINYKGKTVRIFTMGDLCNLCKKVIKELTKNGYKIDILILAYRNVYKSKLDEYIVKLDPKNVAIEKKKAVSEDKKDENDKNAIDKVMQALG